MLSLVLRTAPGGVDITAGTCGDDGADGELKLLLLLCVEVPTLPDRIMLVYSGKKRRNPILRDKNHYEVQVLFWMSH